MPAPEPWPRLAFEAPVLRGLDERSRDELCGAGRVVRLAEGSALYQAGDDADVFYVVVEGRVALLASRRGDSAPSMLREVGRGDTFGEEALLPGATRHARAEALVASQVAEVPARVYQRLAGRSGASELCEREERALWRAATRELLDTLALTAELPELDLELLLDAIRHRRFSRGERLVSAGDPAEAALLIAHGLVQLQRDGADHSVEVRAYLSRGDLLGDEAVVAREPHRTHAVALGDGHCLEIPAEALRTLVDRNPGLLSGLQRVRGQRKARQLPIVGAVAARTTQLVFQDLYRMQMARSLLVIDPDSCVRCGHCAWACAEVHGVARLVRRGDKVVTGADRPLHLPNSCQHCKNPACMIDCPTGAIGREPDGEVFIREELCTGCGACAKACPWENIAMTAGASGAEIAVKCDLCRGYDGPACVQACPTESIVRLDPEREFDEVRALLGGRGAKGSHAKTPTMGQRWLGSAALGALAALGMTGWALSRADGAEPSWFAGVLGGTALVALAAYVVPKRAVGWWMRRPSSRYDGVVRSRVRRYTVWHLAIGCAAPGAVAVHAGARFEANVAGALQLAFWLATLTGVWGALAYALLPPRLSRLERRGSLPEDLPAERARLVDRLHSYSSGRSLLVKRIVERLLVPYARAPLGPVWLVLSGRSLKREQARLARELERVLEGRGGSRLAGLDELVKCVVELRALSARRMLSVLLGAWLPAHVVLAGIAVVLLAVHVLGVVGLG